jgi:hypothetical protein
VSAYAPGLGTALDEDFARNEVKRARDTAIGARGFCCGVELATPYTEVLGERACSNSY